MMGVKRRKSVVLTSSPERSTLFRSHITWYVEEIIILPMENEMIRSVAILLAWISLIRAKSNWVQLLEVEDVYIRGVLEQLQSSNCIERLQQRIGTPHIFEPLAYPVRDKPSKENVLQAYEDSRRYIASTYSNTDIEKCVSQHTASCGWMLHDIKTTCGISINADHFTRTLASEYRLFIVVRSISAFCLTADRRRHLLSLEAIDHIPSKQSQSSFTVTSLLHEIQQTVTAIATYSNTANHAPLLSRPLPPQTAHRKLYTSFGNALAFDATPYGNLDTDLIGALITNNMSASAASAFSSTAHKCMSFLKKLSLRVYDTMPVIQRVNAMGSKNPEMLRPLLQYIPTNSVVKYVRDALRMSSSDRTAMARFAVGEMLPARHAVMSMLTIFDADVISSQERQLLVDGLLQQLPLCRMLAVLYMEFA